MDNMSETERALRALDERITNYLASGGLFNPESMEHVKVRELLRDCRELLPLFNAGIAEAYAAAAKKVLELSWIPLHFRQDVSRNIEDLTPADARNAQPVIRCSDCGGTVIWKKTAEGAKEHVMRLHYLLYVNERGKHIGHCLDFDIVTSADSRDEALKRLNILVGVHMERAVAKTPAPPENWGRFHKVRQVCIADEAAARTPDSTKEQDKL